MGKFLLEDNAEFGLGMHHATKQLRLRTLELTGRTLELTDRLIRSDRLQQLGLRDSTTKMAPAN
jgi:hypothetical protein